MDELKVPEVPIPQPQEDLATIKREVKSRVREGFRKVRAGFRRETIELAEDHWRILEREAKAQDVSVAELIYRTVARQLSRR